VNREPEASRDLARLYRDAIRRHSSNPAGYRLTVEATHRHEAYNPQCGDRVEILLRVPGKTVEAAAFDGEACAICMASASLLCSLAPGRRVAELQALGEALQAALSEPAGAASVTMRTESDEKTNHRKSPPKPLLHPELRPLLGVRPYPSRVRCATLPWSAALNALQVESNLS
jgi:nitrogen fixation NifU-like protein